MTTKELRDILYGSDDEAEVFMLQGNDCLAEKSQINSTLYDKKNKILIIVADSTIKKTVEVGTQNGQRSDI